MPTAQPREERDTQFIRFQALVDHSFKDGVNILRDFTPDLACSFLMKHLEQLWQLEGQIQAQLLGNAPRLPGARIREGYGLLAGHVSQVLTLLFGIDEMLATKRDQGHAQVIDEQELSASIQFVVKWLARLRSPSIWDRETLDAHLRTGFIDRVRSKLDIARGSGIELPA